MIVNDIVALMVGGNIGLWAASGNTIATVFSVLLGVLFVTGRVIEDKQNDQV